VYIAIELEIHGYKKPSIIHSRRAGMQEQKIKRRIIQHNMEVNDNASKKNKNISESFLISCLGFDDVNN
jgi:hypothetical protein